MECKCKSISFCGKVETTMESISTNQSIRQSYTNAHKVPKSYIRYYRSESGRITFFVCVNSKQIFRNSTFTDIDPVFAFHFAFNTNHQIVVASLEDSNRHRSWKKFIQIHANELRIHVCFGRSYRTCRTWLRGMQSRVDVKSRGIFKIIPVHQAETLCNNI